MENKKKISFSGIKPSGDLHIGNYLGAIKQWVKMQDDFDESIYCIVDLHAITVPQDPKKLKENILSTTALYIACGIDPNKADIFVQSTRPEHAELMWILNTFPTIGMLARMTQFKEKSEQIDKKEYQKIGIKLNKINQDEKYGWISAPRFTPLGIFNYPILMAADILLYQTTHVPVGEDQKQHIEITQSLAKRINNIYSSEIFTVPKPVLNPASSRIMSLDDPKKKMSKSDESDAGYISMTDTPDDIKRKIKRAVTDSGSEIKSGDDKPALTNLLNIYSEFSGKSVEDIESDFKDKGYGEFKESLADVIVEGLKTIQEKYKELMADRESLISILNKGSEKIAPVAQKTLKDLKDKIGLGI